MHIMHLLNEMKGYGFFINSNTPTITCKIFEENSGALEMANTHKFRPCTKHINTKLHHFRDYITRGNIKIFPINTKEQLTNYLSKPLLENILVILQCKVIGW